MFRTLSPGDSISVSLRKLLQGSRSGSHTTHIFTRKGAGNLNVKIRHQVKEFRMLCMGMQVSGLAEFIPLIRTWACYFCSVPESRPVLCDPVDCSRPGFSVLHRIPEFVQTHVHRVSDAIQPSHPLSSPFPPAFSLSQHQGLFHWVSSLNQQAKILELQLQHRPSSEYSGLISFRIDCFVILDVQGTLKSLFQHHSLKAPNLWHQAFFKV